MVNVYVTKGPCLEKTKFLDANNKDADHTVQMRSLISTFVIHSLESTVTKLADCQIPMF